MASSSEIRWQVTKQRAELAAGIRKFEAQNWDKLVPVHRFSLPAKPEITVYVFGEGSFRVSDEKVFDQPEMTIELFHALRPYLEEKHPEFFRQYDGFDFRDLEAGRLSKVEKILNAIEATVDESPELKDELIILGKMLQRGEDIKSYIQNLKFHWKS